MTDYHPHYEASHDLRFRPAPQSYPLEPITQAVSAEELRSWLLYPEFTADEIASANTLLQDASEMVVEYTQRELKARKRRLEVPYWPTTGTLAGMVRRRHRALDQFLRLPFGPVIQIDSITYDGTTLDSSEYELVLDRLDMTPRNDLIVNYTAGYNDEIIPLPPRGTRAVLTLAAWLWQHRGEANGGDPLHDSGAARIAQPLKRYAV